MLFSPSRLQALTAFGMDSEVVVPGLQTFCFHVLLRAYGPTEVGPTILHLDSS